MKTALVTGASEGIGREFALSLAKEGYQITAVARNETRLKELIAALGPGHALLVADLADPRGVDLVLKRMRETHFDLVINNAGAGRFGKFRDLSEAEVVDMIRLNCEALARICHLFVRTARSGDAIINVGSTLSFQPQPWNGAYAGTKALVGSLSQTLWHEERARGVYVMALCPGYTLTEFSKRSGKQDSPAFRKFAHTPEQVVATAMTALKRRKDPIVMPGLMNRVLTHVSNRLMPRKSVLAAASATFAKYLEHRS